MAILVKIFLMLFLPPIFVGIINKVKALWAGKKGAPVLQLFYDIRKLLQKGQVISKTTSFIFRMGPTVQLSSVIFAAMFVPFSGLGSIIQFQADFILFAYALGLGKFFLIISAMDTGSSFEGMGASREATFSTIAEPAFFILMASLALLTGQLSFEGIFQSLGLSSGFSILIRILAILALFLMLLTEGSRVPVDDPNTHLELTMIHEVMVLDSSGPDLAYLQMASALKMVLIATLLADLIIPANLSLWVSVLLLLFILMIIAVCVALVESLMARLRMSHVPQFVFIMTALSLTIFASVLFFLQGEFK